MSNDILILGARTDHIVFDSFGSFGMGKTICEFANFSDSLWELKIPPSALDVIEGKEFIPMPWDEKPKTIKNGKFPTSRLSPRARSVLAAAVR